MAKQRNYRWLLAVPALVLLSPLFIAMCLMAWMMLLSEKLHEFFSDCVDAFIRPVSAWAEAGTRK